MNGPLLMDTSVVMAARIHDEPWHTGASVLFAMTEDFHAADILDMELANSLMKCAHRKRISVAYAEQTLAWWRQMPITSHPTADLVPEALHWAVRHHLHVYDLLHVLAAREAGGRLVTLDRKLAANLKAAKLGKWAVGLEDL